MNPREQRYNWNAKRGRENGLESNKREKSLTMFGTKLLIFYQSDSREAVE